MIPYKFDMRFWTPIADGTKRATLRKLRTRPRRHARPGEEIQLWAINDPPLQIRRAECAGVDGVLMELDTDKFCLGDITRNRSTWPNLDLGGREGLAKLCGFEHFTDAAAYWSGVHGGGPFTGCLITWRDMEYAGPPPSRPQLRDLRVLAVNERVIPAYGKISSAVAHSLLVLQWAEVCDRSQAITGREQRSYVPIRITDLGRWILERFGP